MLDIIGAFLSVYGFFLVCVLILMAVTHTAWVTYDTNWLNVLKFMLIAPLVIMVLVASWLIASYIRTERLLKTFIETPAESPRMEEADTYLRALLSSGTLRERNYPKVREARAACFKDGRIVSRKIRDYRQILYDIDLKDVPCEEIEINETNAYHFVLTSAIDFPTLSADDQQILDKVIQRFGMMKKEDLVEFMHQEKAYKKTDLWDVISFEYAAYLQI